MQTDNQTNPNDDKPWWRRINYEFYYLERVGNRQYLRFTPFGLISIIVSVILLFAYFIIVAWYDSYKHSNTNIDIPAASPNKQSDTAVTPGPGHSSPHSRNR